MARVGVHLVGFKALGRAIGRLGDVEPYVEPALFETLETIRSESIEEVPVDQGDLRNSAFAITDSLRATNPLADPSPEAVAEAQTGPNLVSGVVGYGGPAAEYAFVTHENPRAGKTGGRSPSGKKYVTWAKVGKWKYLEHPFFRLAPTLSDVLRKHWDRHVKRARGG